MTLKTAVLKPGLLVSLKTSVRGGISYQRTDLEADHKADDGSQSARWETTRTIADAQEYERATKVRGKARSLISSVCYESSFGLLCPSNREGELEAAIAAARAFVDSFNFEASRTQVEVYVLAGRVARDDVEAARAISAEVRELMDAMQQGIQSANPEAIREAASKARSLGGMLSADVSGKVNEAVTEARAAAREIVKRVEKAGEVAADVVAELSLAKITSARFAFLDLEEEAGVQSVAVVTRSLDLEAEEAWGV